MPETRTVSILGCGWLGLPLGRMLLERGYHVKGSTTTPEKQDVLTEAGVAAYTLRLVPTLEGERVADFFRADVLFLNVPPPRRDDAVAYHRRQIQAVIDAVQKAPISLVVFASTTGVYPNLNRTVDEADAGAPERQSGAAVWAAEQLLREADGIDLTVLRFGGLYGYDRQPGRFLAGRTDVAGPEAPVNLVHRDDAVAVAVAVIEQDVRGDVFNVCADVHPTRRAFYVQAARQLGLDVPTFSDEAAPFKQVSNRRLKEHLGYTFRYPDPMAPAP